ncbi:MAG: Cyclopropane-fatty-acyl-phospholipid synthase [Chlamydiia bacterium]|nr:Cyclopropane-fatty-acyl-phospholipid synthase [Chlamydiia bacterium]MCH9615926.1 Cyclopropane-fatty-acyl-phospholipid synthase [Chlamydiia bacterium]MCH9628671.1 Cyclopropane-fatty-acyl-phospholipid synthase [Chlamydiia bacterium]
MRSLFCFLLISLSTLFGGNSKQVIEDMASVANVKVNGSRSHDIQVHNEAFYDRVLREQSLGLGEAYMEGWWDSEALDECMYRIIRANVEGQFGRPSMAMIWAYVKAKVFNMQSKSGSMKVINAHYQLGNDLYENMLDPLMTYSCGYWKRARNLNEAQVAKYDLIAQKLSLKPGMRVLDIGCGWGGFARYIAENYGVSVVAITLSEKQAGYAKKMCQGLPVEVRVQDYRDVDGKFDRVVEIGMFEHVGSKNYRTFMEVAYARLNDNGMVMLHTIGSNKSNVAGDPWIDKYIFRGGQLPSIAQVGKSIEGLFVMEDWHNFSTDYDKTLMAWHANFVKNWPKIKEQYPDPFYRMWRYYLLSCAATFRARHIQLWQVVLSKNGVLGGYESVR